MFNKPLVDVSFDDIQDFCRQWPEGVRVEYKSQLIDNIPRTISAFANTLGGILVMGVSTDPKTNKVVFPIQGMDQTTGLEERLTQSSLTGIYPAVLPEVRILEVPGKPNKIVMVVKIHESTEAPHAIQNSTRVYIRTGNISSPYSLAEIDRIEYLLKRRERPEKLREDIIAKSHARFEDHVSKDARKEPYIEVEVLKTFPYDPIMPPGAVYEFVQIKGLSSTTFGRFIQNPKRILNGVFSTGRNRHFPYSELNTYALVLTKSQLSLWPSSWVPNTGKLFVRPADVIWTIGRSLALAEQFFRFADFSGNVRVVVQVVNVLNLCLQYSGYEDEDSAYACSDRELSVFQNVATEELNANVVQLITELVNDVFWAFNCEYNDLQNTVSTLLKNERLI